MLEGSCWQGPEDHVPSLPAIMLSGLLIRSVPGGVERFESAHGNIIRLSLDTGC